MKANVDKQAEKLTDQAFAAHQQGDLAAAAALYRQALDIRPRDADALHLLGVAEHQMGRHAEAAELIGRAIGLNRRFPAYHANLGVALQELGRLDEAAAAFTQAIKLDTNYIEPRHNLALLRKRQERWGEAESGFAAVLRLNPDYAEARRQMGQLLLERGRINDALPHLSRAVDLLPGDAAALNNMSVALRASGRHEEALAYQQAAARHAPRDPALLGNLAGTLFAAGALAEAADAFAQALALDGRNPGLLNNFGLTLQAMGRLDDAAACFDAALAADRRYAPAHDNLGTLHTLRGRPAAAVPHHQAAAALDPLRAAAWNNLGNALSGAGDRAKAAPHWRRALALDPVMAEAWINLGVGLTGGEDFPAAAAALRRALLLAPDSAAAWNNLGDALRLTDGDGLSLRRYARAAALEPDYAEAWSNVALARQRGGDWAAASTGFDRALRINPELAGARFNRGLLRLEKGDLADGWPDYAYRFASGKIGRGRTPPMQPWRGEALGPGRKLLVWREQGLGDEILFASTYRHLLERGVDAVFECDKRLVGLLSRALPGETLVRAESVDAAGRETINPPDCDRHVPAGSLARLLRSSLSAFPDQGPWLAPDPVRLRHWRDRLETDCGPQLRVGIAWRSQLMTAERRAAYLDLADFAPLFALPGVAWVNAQYGDVESEIAAAEARFGVRLHRWADLDLKNDLEGAAALTANLDLVVAPAASAAELSAALGVPTWRLGGRDWTGLGTGARPWTPTVRVFTPKVGESLAAVVGRLAGALRSLTVANDASRSELDRLEPGPPEADSSRLNSPGLNLPELNLSTLNWSEPDPRRLVNAATARLNAGDPAGAQAQARAAAALDPALPEALMLAGVATPDQAMAWPRRALAIAPGHAGASANVGRWLAADGDWRGAFEHLRRAVAAAPGRAPIYANLCHVLRFLGQNAAAERAADRTLILDPVVRSAQAERGLLRLTRGDLPGGWADYQARKCGVPSPPSVDALSGKIVEVTAEQGLGDEILFAACLPDLLRTAAQARLVCDRRLVGLFARSFPGLEVRPHGTPDPQKADVALSAGDLPGLFRRDLASFAAGGADQAESPLLTVDPTRKARWARVLAAEGDGLKIGVAWTSGMAAAERDGCRTALTEWRPLAMVPGAMLVNLQYGEVDAEIVAAEREWGVKIRRWPGLDLKNDLEETAALCAALDLVVAVPTAAGELAAAVGAPTWRLTPAGDWTQLGTRTRPWLPTQRVIEPPSGLGLAAALRAAARILMAS